MPTLEEVKAQIGRIDGASRFLGRKEIKELPRILWDDEIVERLVQGTYEAGMGVLVATNKRLMFVDKGIGKLRVEDFPYDKLTSIQYETGWMLGGITIFASGNKAEIKNVAKDQCRGFADYVRNRITAVSHHVSAPAPHPPAQAVPVAVEPVRTRAETASVIDQLERLAKLREQGVLTDEEFQAEKAKLLGG